MGSIRVNRLYAITRWMNVDYRRHASFVAVALLGSHVANMAYQPREKGTRSSAFVERLFPCDRKTEAIEAFKLHPATAKQCTKQTNVTRFGFEKKM